MPKLLKHNQEQYNKITEEFSNGRRDMLLVQDTGTGKEGIKLPSPEDDERDKDNGAALYGTVYADLLDNVENALKDLLERADAKAPIVTDIFE